MMEKYVAVFDIGTTAIKGVLVNDQATITGEYNVLVDTYHGEDGEIEQSPTDWWQGVKEITQKWWTEFKLNPEQIVALTFTGQIEDVIPISSTYPDSKAILYLDTRSEKEAEYIKQKMPTIHHKIGNTIRSSTPLSKLLWLKENDLDFFEETECFVFSSKDYIIYKLTNTFVTDPTTAATTGMMSLNTRDWISEILETLQLNSDRLPKIHSTEEIVGHVTKSAAEETGFLESTPVLCGSGDAGASTLGAAAVNPGDIYFYTGTTGWAASVQDNNKPNKKNDNIFTLSHLPKNVNISIAPILNAGNVYEWAVETFTNKEAEGKYEKFERLAEGSPTGSNGLLFLPYLNGERFPINDPKAKGAFWGISPKTKQSDMARSVVEGICFSYKQLIDLTTEKEGEGSVTLIGGGSKSAFWCQVLADVIGRPVRVPDNSEYMPALGIASSAFITLGWAESYNDFVEQFLITAESKLYRPDMLNREIYERNYQQYVKMYPNLKGIYN